MSYLALHDVSKVLKDTVIVDRLSLEVDEGEFLVILGPSGCGKSTTLNMIAGLEEPTAGEIYIKGRRVTHLPPKDRKIAMVFQNYALYPHMTVAQNLGFGLKMARTPQLEIQRQVGSVAKMLGIDGMLERKPRELSGGQRQRVAVGRALVRNPDVFLLDEPLSNLDAQLRGHMRVELKQIHERVHATTVYVTHDQTEAMTMASRIVVMRAGIIQQIGAPLEIYNHPSNRFVAEFLGSPSMNFIPCRFEREADRLYAVGAGMRVRVPTDPSLALKGTIPSDIVIGVRPEDIEIEDTGAADFGTELGNAEIVAIEPLGNATYVSLRFNGQLLTAVTSARMTLRVHEFPRIRFNESKLHLFEACPAGTAFRLS